MAIPMILIMIVAPIGAIDVLYYHLLKFKLYKQPSSKKETITHLIRGFLFGIGALILFNFQPHGSWFWIIGAIFVLDFLNSIADVSLERDSRASLGGIPPCEYIIHTIGSTFAGAITATYFIMGWSFQTQPTALMPIDSRSLPMLFTLQGILLAGGSLTLTAVEGFLFLRTNAKRFALP